jgi:hypothetical protein
MLASPLISDNRLEAQQQAHHYQVAAWAYLSVVVLSLLLSIYLIRVIRIKKARIDR